MGSLSRQEPVGLLLGAAVRGLKRLVTARAGALGFTARQYWVLVAILETDAPSLGALAARLRIDEPTASRVIATLVRRRLVRVEPVPADRRRTRLCPTTKAEALRPTLVALAGEIRGSVVDGLGPARQEVLRAGLRHVISNMERALATTPGRPRRARPEAEDEA